MVCPLRFRFATSIYGLLPLSRYGYPPLWFSFVALNLTVHGEILGAPSLTSLGLGCRRMTVARRLEDALNVFCVEAQKRVVSLIRYRELDWSRMSGNTHWVNGTAFAPSAPNKIDCCCEPSYHRASVQFCRTCSTPPSRITASC